MTERHVQLLNKTSLVVSCDDICDEMTSSRQDHKLLINQFLIRYLGVRFVRDKILHNLTY